MTCWRVRLFYALAIAGSLGGSSACGGLANETGNDAGRRESAPDSASDVAVADAARDSPRDVASADTALPPPPIPDAGDAGGMDAPDATCSPGAVQCVGNGVETCASNGMWAGFLACTNMACVDGACTGVCTPGATQCSSNDVEICGPDGQWGAPWSCATGTCSAGACTGSTTTGTSCQTSNPGVSNCGTSSESCCTSEEVAGSTFSRTYANSGSGPTGEADPAAVSGSRLDKYLVTVGRFRPFVTAWIGGYAPPAGSGKHAHLNGGMGLSNSASAGGYEPGWAASDDGNIAPTDANLACEPYGTTWTPSAGTQENLPINCANWYEAYAFCIWDGGFLPSEAEWEFAAAGGGGVNGQREYPWGSTDPGTDNQYAIYADDYDSDGMVAPVGTATSGAGLWGQLDLAGEVFEWNLDVLAAYVDPCVDCANLTTEPDPHAAHGGNFGLQAADIEPPVRTGFPQAERDFIIGFRCARVP